MKVVSKCLVYSFPRKDRLPDDRYFGRPSLCVMYTFTFLMVLFHYSKVKPMIFLFPDDRYFSRSTPSILPFAYLQTAPDSHHQFSHSGHLPFFTQHSRTDIHSKDLYASDDTITGI